MKSAIGTANGSRLYASWMIVSGTTTSEIGIARANLRELAADHELRRVRAEGPVVDREGELGREPREELGA